MSSWTAQEVDDLQKPLRIKFTRFIPSNTKIELLVNYETIITEFYSEVNPGSGIYKILDNSVEQNLKGVKLGTNRVSVVDKLSQRPDIKSSMDKPGMEDYLFELNGDLIYSRP